ncbi:hypothetical protein D3C85_1756150 [compost metagenome]
MPVENEATDRTPGTPCMAHTKRSWYCPKATFSQAPTTSPDSSDWTSKTTLSQSRPMS